MHSQGSRSSPGQPARDAARVLRRPVWGCRACNRPSGDPRGNFFRLAGRAPGASRLHPGLPGGWVGRVGRSQGPYGGLSMTFQVTHHRRPWLEGRIRRRPPATSMQAEDPRQPSERPMWPGRSPHPSPGQPRVQSEGRYSCPNWFGGVAQEAILSLIGPW